MKPFHTIAIPHKDILEGRLTMDTFAADLWEAFHNRGVAEYRDSELFFQKTYLTAGLKNLLNIVQRRIEGKEGDPVIQIQTPFGGGKTHSLIALMHKAKEWGAKRVVIVGTSLSAERRLWEIMEEQLTGKIAILSGPTSPGKERIKSLLEQHEPAVILMDELLEYLVKASGVKVGESTLASQILAFMQELSETVSSMKRISLVVTLPASVLEHYDHNAETFYTQIQKIIGRVEKIYTPVDEQEIAKVIRQRLFSLVNKKETTQIVNEFMKYAEQENILPPKIEIEYTEYRNRFLDSYPFIPEVIDILYHRWGSFPSFQRTRGVLRILSLVIHSLKNSTLPYISLADFNLANQEVRQELIKHIGNEYNSIIAQDITDAEAGSKKIDDILGDSYRGLKLATRTSTTIFMYSFSGGSERGATLAEIKRCATTLNNPATVVSEALEQLKSKLFYTQFQNDKYYFSNTPNLNRILLNKIENITERDVKEKEKELIRSQLSGKYFKSYIWEETPSNIPDNPDLKLLILREEKEGIIKQIIKTKGASPRIYCNIVLFLCPVAHEHSGLIATIKKYLANESLLKDKTIRLEREQKKEMEESLQKTQKDILDMLLRAYQCVIIPSKEGYQKECIGIPTYGENKKLDERVYEKLRSNNKILEFISPTVIKQKYIGQNTYILTKNLLEAFYKTPGEIIIASTEVLEKSITEGVQRGDFGIGEVDGEQIKCLFYKKEPEITFNDVEILIKAELCEQQTTETYLGESGNIKEKTAIAPTGILYDGSQEGSTFDTDNRIVKKKINISFDVPHGKVTEVMRILANIQSNLEKISIHIKGELTEQQHEIIKETSIQLNIDLKENDPEN